MAELSKDNKRIVKNTIFLYIRLFVTLSVSLYTNRVVLEELGVEDCGIYNIVATLIVMFSMFSSFFTSSCQRYISYAIGEGDDVKVSLVYSAIKQITFGCALIVVTIAFIGAKFVVEDLLVVPVLRIEAAYYIYYCSIISFFFSIVLIPYTSLLTAYERMDFIAIISIVESLLKLTAVISLPYLFGDKLEGYGFLLSLIAFVVLIINALYCKKRIGVVGCEKRVDKKLLKEMMTFSGWTGVGTFAGMLKDNGGNIVLNNFYGVLYNTARGFAATIQNLLNQFTTNVSNAINPQITKSYAAGDVDRAIRLTIFSVKALSIVMAVTSLPFLVQTEFLLELWLKNVPNYTNVFVRYAVVLTIVHTIAMSYGTLYLAIGKLKRLQIINFCLCMIYLPVTCLIYYSGAKPEAFLTVGIVLELLMLYTNFEDLRRSIGFPSGVVYRYVGIYAVVLFFSSYLAYEIRDISSVEYVNVTISILAGIFLFVVFGYIVLLSKSERLIVCNLLSSAILKKKN